MCVGFRSEGVGIRIQGFVFMEGKVQGLGFRLKVGICEGWGFASSTPVTT